MPFIYSLADPESGDVRYIGKANYPQARLSKHIKICQVRTSPHLYAWLRSVVQKGLEPVLEILEEVSEDDWQVAEKEWIANALDDGIFLTNMVPGGLGGAVVGRHVDATTRMKISMKLKGRPSPAKGKKWSAEHRRKFSATRMARENWKPRLGMHNSAEHNAKIGMANSVAHKGRKLSAAEVECRKAAAKARWAKPGERERWGAVSKTRKRNCDGSFACEEILA